MVVGIAGGGYGIYSLASGPSVSSLAANTQLTTVQLGGTSTNPVVTVMVNGQAEQRAVTLGVTDNVQTEVVQGLNEGDVVVVQVAASTGGQSSSGGFQGFPGGGPPDGGFFISR